MNLSRCRRSLIVLKEALWPDRACVLGLPAPNPPTARHLAAAPRVATLNTFVGFLALEIDDSATFRQRRKSPGEQLTSLLRFPLQVEKTSPNLLCKFPQARLLAALFS